MSTPDSEVYSPVGAAANPYHVRELTRDEFAAALAAQFSYVAILGQRALVGSAIVPRQPNGSISEPVTYERRDDTHFERSPGLPRAVYLIACASNRPLTQSLGGSLYLHQSHVEAAMGNARAQLETRLAEAERAAREAQAGRREAERMLTAQHEASAGVLTSTSWRGTGPLRVLGQRLPRGLRRLLSAALGGRTRTRASSISNPPP